MQGWSRDECDSQILLILVSLPISFRRQYHPSLKRVLRWGICNPSVRPHFLPLFSGNKLRKDWRCMAGEWTSCWSGVARISWHRIRFRQRIQFRKRITSNANWRKWTFSAHKLLLSVVYAYFITSSGSEMLKAKGNMKRINLYSGTPYTTGFLFKNHISQQGYFKNGLSQSGDWNDAMKVCFILIHESKTDRTEMCGFFRPKESSCGHSYLFYIGNKVTGPSAFRTAQRSKSVCRFSTYRTEM